MTKIFTYGSLTLGLSCLAVGWTLAGYWSVGLTLFILLPISLVLAHRKFRPVTGLALMLSALAAAIGLWVRVDLSLALVAVACVLAAWDLDHFSRRLVFASSDDNPQRLECSHLMQVSLLLLLGVGLDLFSQTISYSFGFEWALILAVLAFYGIGALINGMRSAAG